MNTDIAAQLAIDRLRCAGPDALTPTEKTLAAVWLFAAGVGNSGFNGYYSTWRGDLAFDAPRALLEVGARRLSELAAAANAVFGEEGPPKNRVARQQKLEALSAEKRELFTRLEDRYFSCEEDPDELLEAYLARAASAAPH